MRVRNSAWESRRRVGENNSAAAAAVPSPSRVCLLCGPMDRNPQGSSVRETGQARMLEGAAISFSRGSSPSRDGTHISCIAGEGFFMAEPPGTPQFNSYQYLIENLSC